MCAASQTETNQIIFLGRWALIACLEPMPMALSYERFLKRRFDTLKLTSGGSISEMRRELWLSISSRKESIELRNCDETVLRARRHHHLPRRLQRSAAIAGACRIGVYFSSLRATKAL